MPWKGAFDIPGVTIRSDVPRGPALSTLRASGKA
jgi:hypothetical protein